MEIDEGSERAPTLALRSPQEPSGKKRKKPAAVSSAALVTRGSACLGGEGDGGKGEARGVEERGRATEMGEVTDEGEGRGR